MGSAQRISVLLKLCWQLLVLRLTNQQGNQYQSRHLLFTNFTHLGGVYIKFLQILALNVEFLKGWAGPKEFEIFEAAPFEPIDIESLLQRELPNYTTLFQSIERTPFAAGSFAQVYRAKLCDNSDVVIKVLRPSLAKNLSADLRLLGIITRISGWLYPRSLVALGDVYRQFAQTVRQETNYRREVGNAQWFYNYFQPSPDIVIPKTYAELSGEHVIVQEFVEGISLAEVIQAQKHGQPPAQLVHTQLGSNLWVQLETLGAELLTAAVLADFVIGDPHPGNIKLLPDNKIGIIDFGIAAPAPSNRHAFLELIREYQKLYAEQFDPSSFTIAALKFFDEDLVQAVTTASRALNPDLALDVILQQLGQSANQALAATSSAGQTQNLLRRKMMMQLFNQAINEHNRFGVHMNLDAAVMLKAAVTYLSMVGSIGEHGENFEVIYHAISTAIARADAHQIPVEPTKPAPSVEQALDILSSWLSRMADTDPFLYRKITATITS